MTSNIQQKVTELTFLDNSIKYATKILAQILSPYGVEYSVKSTTNVAWEARQQQLEGGTAQFPLISVVISRMEDSPDFQWNKQALFNGRYLKDKNYPGVIKQIKLSYQKVTLTVTITTESGQQMLDMVKRWKFRERKAQFNITGEGLTVACKCLFDSTFDFPQQDVTDSGNTFVLTGTITLYTYIGECVYIPAIKQVDLNFQARSLNGTILEQRNIVRKNIA